MDEGRLNLLEECGREEGESEEKAEHNVGGEEEEGGGEQASQLDMQAGRHVADGVHLCTVLDSTVQYSTVKYKSTVLGRIGLYPILDTWISVLRPSFVLRVSL